MTKMIEYVKFNEELEEIREMICQELSKNLNLTKIPSPIFLKNDFLSDTLDGAQRLVEFDFKNGEIGTLLHSLAKWKRCILHKYQFERGHGIITNMHAVRRDEEIDSTHSFFVDQWDWERVISKEDRNFTFLKEIVSKIYDAFRLIDIELSKKRSEPRLLPDEFVFLSTQDIANDYPDLSPEKREYEAVKKHGAVFIHSMGHKLDTEKQERHCIRAPDYDDWKLNGDLIFYHKPLDCALEISSMGIRVDSESIQSQIFESSTEINKIPESTASLTPSYSKYHQSIIDEEFPLTVGGGIGQSRVLMFFMKRKDVHDVQGLCKIFNN